MKASAKYNAYGFVLLAVTITFHVMETSDAKIAMALIVAAVFFATSDLLKALGK
jgi:hypothetical protein